MQKKQHEKSCEIKVGGPEVAAMDNGKILKNNSGKFVLPPPSFTRNQHQNSAFLHGPHLLYS